MIDVDKVTCGHVVLTELFDITAMTLSRWVQDGMPKYAKGVYPLKDCIRWAFERMRSQAGHETSEIQDSRRMLYDVQRAKHELEIKRINGEVVDVEVVASAVREMASIFATQLDGLAPRMAAQLATINNPTQIQRELFRETREIRRATCHALNAFASRENGGADGHAATGEGRGSMGRGVSHTSAGQPGAGEVED